MAFVAYCCVRTNSLMVTPALPTIRSSDLRLAACLLLAVLLHALLLLLPAQRAKQPVESLRQLSVSLQRAVSLPVSPPVMQESEPAPLPKEAPRPRPPAGPAQKQTASPEVTESPPGAPEHPAELSTARLLDLAGRREWTIDSPGENRRLGEFQPQPLPRNWQPGIPREANLFDDMAVPQRVEIVDRWLADDGSHNVVVNTPSGETYCGRAAAWSPTNPLFEPIMMWRPCGGGGKRTFRMPERYVRGAAGTDRP